MKHDGNNWVFSSGQKRYGFTEKLSIEFDDAGMPSIAYGYDGGFWDHYELRNEIIEPEEKLSTSDLLELADHQIQRWQKFRQWLSDLNTGSQS